MEFSYSTTHHRPKFAVPLFIAFLILILSGAGYLIFGRQSGFISPLPEEPALEIIFYTPTPEELTPTSSASAVTVTPVKATVTEKPKRSVTPSDEITPTPTEKP